MRCTVDAKMPSNSGMAGNISSACLSMHLGFEYESPKLMKGRDSKSTLPKNKYPLLSLSCVAISPLSVYLSLSYRCVLCSGVRRLWFDAPPIHWLKSINFSNKIIHRASYSSFSKREARCPQVLSFETEAENACNMLSEHV